MSSSQLVLGSFLSHLFYKREFLKCREYVLFIIAFPETNIVLSTLLRETIRFSIDE